MRKGVFDKVKTKTFQLNKIQVNNKLINEFIKSANKVKKTINFCKKVAGDSISNNDQLKQGFDNNKRNQNVTNIQRYDMFTTGLKEIKKLVNKLILLLMKLL